MRRNTVNFALDVCLLVLMAGMAVTGLAMRWVLPPGTGGRLSLWGMDRHDIGDVHFYMTLGLGGLLILHLAMHWSWVCSLAVRLVRPARPEGARVSGRGQLVGAAAALLAIAGLVAGALYFASSQTKSTSGMHRSGSQEPGAYNAEGGGQRRRGRHEQSE